MIKITAIRHESGMLIEKICLMAVFIAKKSSYYKKL